ncbi:MAG TPA: hypothetical protein DER09_02995 [Prolixibacteraceae bacterium]|nr:hypothetical protein [Prolixibacteraceae bacterium]
MVIGTLAPGKGPELFVYINIDLFYSNMVQNTSVLNDELLLNKKGGKPGIPIFHLFVISV